MANNYYIQGKKAEEFALQPIEVAGFPYAHSGTDMQKSFAIQ
jgi:hypothetical protein